MRIRGKDKEKKKYKWNYEIINFSNDYLRIL